MFVQTKRNLKYHKASSEESLLKDSSGEYAKHESLSPPIKLPWTAIQLIVPWILTLIFACSTAGLLLGGKFLNNKGFDTDFYPAKQAISHEVVRFTGSPAICPNGSLYIPNPDPIRYIGEPGPDVDKNWDAVTGDYFLITKQEAKAAWGEDVQQFWDEHRGGYVAGLDMFHTLHCVAQLRRMLHAEYYKIKMDKDMALHRDHCIEQVRQYIMCAGDITPIPTRFYSGLGRNYVDSDYPHTCRNFGKLNEWVIERFSGQSAVKPDLGPRL